MSRQFPTSAASHSVAPGRARIKGVDYYRQRARECREQAAQTADPYSREILEQMAADWLSLVREAEAGASPFLTEIGHKIG
ncbi:MAG TPA: hypothetical protein VJO12_03375 [Stellaceae bacterium]|nr:hypothetical protein [Stellaceae bacterium]